jgi:hypothetical protein
MPPSTGLSDTQFSTLNSDGSNDPEGPKNITTLKLSTGQLFYSCLTVVKYKNLETKTESSINQYCKFKKALFVQKLPSKLRDVIRNSFYIKSKSNFAIQIECVHFNYYT